MKSRKEAVHMPQRQVRNEVMTHFNDIEADEEFYISNRTRRTI
jgi:hypothetical protein